MEMQSRHRSKRGAIEVQEQGGEDRLSRLPDDILHSILRGLPLKNAARTSALSRRWARTWLRALASSRVLDFTDRDFARRQASARAAAATVSCCLRLHAEHGAPLDVFRVVLTSPAPGTAGAFVRDVVGWVAYALARGAREVQVDLRPPPTKGDADDESAAFVELPGDLFVTRNSLARLALGRFSLRGVPAGAAGLAGLRSLSLSHADVTGEEARGVVSSCRALELLSLNSCGLLKSVTITSETLRVLEIVRCPAVRELRVDAPALESFAFHDDDLESFSSFFDRNPLPLLDRLFVRFPGHATDASDAAAALAGEVVDDSKLKIYFDDFVLDSLSFIKLVNFRGTRFELQLLAFLLKRAPALEHLVLVTVGEEGGAPLDEHVIQGWVSEMRKASPGAQLTVCRSREDRSQNPVHTRFYHELEA